MNKSAITNFLALAVTAAGYVLNHSLLLTAGLFALSGALTNWLAVHMLFEKVPGLYGSGVIPEHFDEFKQGIKTLIMEQFFTEQNIERFLQPDHGIQPDLHLAPVLHKLDLNPLFDALMKAIEQSSLGSMLALVGGAAAVEPLRQPFIDNARQSLEQMTRDESFVELLRDELEQPRVLAQLSSQVEQVVQQRLDELTPRMVKEIVARMIRRHLGWLVVWGGVFGGLIGVAAGLAGR